jgi:anti-sigma28 factor (negative regulator of flagellin synthesis)
MRINGGNSGPIRPDSARAARGTTPDAAAKQSGNHPAVERQDTVEISDAGRAKSAEAAPTDRASRLAEIRQRILQGAYDSDAVVGEVARRILDRGDL